MIADLIVIAVIILLSVFWIARFLNKRKKNKDNPYPHACSSCSMANKCLKIKDKDNLNKD